MSKVLFIISSLNTGGAQRVLSNVLLYLPKDWTLHTIVNNTEHICFPYHGELIDLGISSKSKLDSIWSQGRIFAKRLITIRKLKKKNNYDFVLSFLSSANVVNILTKNSNCKTIITCHASVSASRDKTKKIQQLLARLSYNKADCLIAVSKGVATDYIKHLGIKDAKVKIIYNGIDLLHINSELQQLHRVSDNIFRICTMGRLTEQKGQWHLIRAVSHLLKEGHNIELHILGIGNLEKYLRALSKDLGITSSIFFDGFVSPPYTKMAECDLFVFPSLWEGFGNVIIEAAACGLPTISSDYMSGAREILAPDTDESIRNTSSIEYAQYGILVPVCSGKKYNAQDELESEEILLCDAIRTMLLDQNLYLSYKQKCRELANKFSMETIRRQWISLLEN